MVLYVVVAVVCPHCRPREDVGMQNGERDGGSCEPGPKGETAGYMTVDGLCSSWRVVDFDRDRLVERIRNDGAWVFVVFVRPVKGSSGLSQGRCSSTRF